MERCEEDTVRGKDEYDNGRGFTFSECIEAQRPVLVPP